MFVILAKFSAAVVELRDKRREDNILKRDIYFSQKGGFNQLKKKIREPDMIITGSKVIGFDFI